MVAQISPPSPFLSALSLSLDSIADAGSYSLSKSNLILRRANDKHTLSEYRLYDTTCPCCFAVSALWTRRLSSRITHARVVFCAPDEIHFQYPKGNSTKAVARRQRR